MNIEHFYTHIILLRSLYLLSHLMSLALWQGFLRTTVITKTIKLFKTNYGSHIPCVQKIPF